MSSLRSSRSPGRFNSDVVSQSADSGEKHAVEKDVSSETSVENDFEEIKNILKKLGYANVDDMTVEKIKDLVSQLQRNRRHRRDAVESTIDRLQEGVRKLRDKVVESGNKIVGIAVLIIFIGR